VKEDTDSDIPSARSVAALNLLRLACLTGREDLRHMADTTTRPSKGSNPPGATMRAWQSMLASILRQILALKERHNYNIHKTHTGLENAPRFSAIVFPPIERMCGDER